MWQWLVETVDVWLVLGFAAQALFSARFLVQWIASERAGRSVVPAVFWLLSISGAAMLLLYALHRRDPVFILGQSAGVLIYSRNLHMIWREKHGKSARAPAAPISRSAGAGEQCDGE